MNLLRNIQIFEMNIVKIKKFFKYIYFFVCIIKKYIIIISENSFFKL